MRTAENAFKRAIGEGQLQIGLWSSLCSPVAAELLSDVGFDWVLYDSEHSPIEISDLYPLLQAAACGSARPVVRPAWNDPVLIKRVLDIGSESVLIPFVQNEAEARNAVSASRYPPAGIRGVAGSTRASRYGRVKDYLSRANEEVCVLVQVETAHALSNVGDIAAVDGVDGVFIGPSDLAASLGHIGEPNHPDVQQAIFDAVNSLKAIGKPAGVLAINPDAARRYIDWGFTFVAVGVDVSLLAQGAEKLVAAFKTTKDSGSRA